MRNHGRRQPVQLPVAPGMASQTSHVCVTIPSFARSFGLLIASCRTAMGRPRGLLITTRNLPSRRHCWLQCPCQALPRPAPRSARSAHRPSILSPPRSPNASRAPTRAGTPIIELTGTGAGMKLFCAGVGERFPDIAERVAPDQGVGGQAVRRQRRHQQITEIQVGLDGIALATAKSLAALGLTHATSISRSPRRRSASRTRRRPGRTSTPSCRRCRSASTARRRPAAPATRSAS